MLYNGIEKINVKVKVSILFFITCKMIKRQTPRNNISKAIQDFNRQCAEEKTKKTPSNSLRFNKRIQNYGIDMNSKIGEGTFSKVYNGRQLLKGLQVAVKIVELKKIKEMGIQQLFWEQLNIIKRLKHPNIITCFEYFRTNNNCYTIYEYCQSGDLAKLLRKGHFSDKEDINQANTILKDVFQGLLYLESMNIVHRDIKAANILMAHGKAKIGDFGFATHCKSQFKDVSIGSPAYMAPEGLIYNIYGPKTDVWSFGILIYQMLHGKTPFCQCESESELKKKVQVPVNWDQLKGILPSPLKRLILKCLKVDYEQRPTFSELLNDEYIQKIYQQGSNYRTGSKSFSTKLTSDSQDNSALRIRLSKDGGSLSPLARQRSRSPRIDQLQSERQRVEGDEMGSPLEIKRVLKTQTCQEQKEQVFIPELISSVNLLDIIKSGKDLNSVRQVKQDTIKQQEHKDENIKVVDKFFLLKEEIDSQQVQVLLNTLRIFRETFQFVKLIKDQKLLTYYFPKFISRLIVQIYSRASSSNYAQNIPAILELLASIPEDFSGTSGQEVGQLQQLMKLTGDELFALVKISQQMIDRQDICSHIDQKPPLVLAKPVIKMGNLLILSLQLLSHLSSKQQLSKWCELSRCQMSSSQQFYIWLYEVELSRMGE